MNHDDARAGLIADEKRLPCNCTPTVGPALPWREGDREGEYRVMTHAKWCDSIHPKWRRPRPS